MGHGRGRDEIERQLVEGTLWLVSELAQSGASAEVPAEDLFQEGSAALVTLVHGLDPARLLSGEEVLEQIRATVGRVMVALVAADRESREEDRRWAQEAERLSQVEAGLRRSLGANPTDHQLSRSLGWPVGRVAQLRQALAEARAQSDEQFMEIVGEAASE